MPSSIDIHDLSTVLDTSQYAMEGFCEGWEVRRHKDEGVADQGSYEARQDWLRLVGPNQEFGSCNPRNGNWTALVMPFCLPERIRIIGYIFEFAFIHDAAIEKQLPDGSEDHTGLSDPTTTTTIDPQLGKKHLRAKMAAQLLAIDPIRGKECLQEWQRMIDTTHRDKTTTFNSVEEYVEFRLVDSGAPWTASLMAFGMGITLPAEEKERLKHVIQPYAAAAGLANDYFSFDKEYDEYLEEQEEQQSPREQHDDHVGHSQNFNSNTSDDSNQSDDGSTDSSNEDNSSTTSLDDQASYSSVSGFDEDCDHDDNHSLSTEYTHCTTPLTEKPTHNPNQEPLTTQHNHHHYHQQHQEQKSSTSTPVFLNLIPVLTSLNLASSIPSAKHLLRDITRGYEREYERRVQEYRADYLLRHGESSSSLPAEIERYLIGLKYVLAGNIVWSINCPRYHFDMRYDPNAGVEDEMSRVFRNTVIG